MAETVLTQAAVRQFLSGLVVAVASMSISAPAAQPEAAKAEVEQLLARLAGSGCQFQRNGTWHGAAEARAHLQKKYRYLLEKRPASTPEDFIALAASKSSTSGKPYLVKCAGQREVSSAAWMAAQLKQLRATKTANP
jgi:hypothetical protein